MWSTWSWLVVAAVVQTEQEAAVLEACLRDFLVLMRELNFGLLWVRVERVVVQVIVEIQEAILFCLRHLLRLLQEILLHLAVGVVDHKLLVQEVLVVLAVEQEQQGLAMRLAVLEYQAKEMLAAQALLQQQAVMVLAAVAVVLAQLD
jgi:hypothetical protein